MLILKSFSLSMAAFIFSLMALGEAAVGSGLHSALSTPPIRFQQISERLFRSGLAANESEYAFYRAQGIKTIVDLRQGADTDDERAKAEAFGFRYVNIPLSQASTPSDYLHAERRFFSVVDDPQNGRVVFHCRHGKDRTGLMAALYRVEREQWSPETAIEEWRAFDGYASDWGDEIKLYFSARTKILSRRTCQALFR